MSKYLSIFICLWLCAQSFVSVADPQIQKSVLLDQLVDKHIEYNQNFPPQGFRLILFVQSGNHSKNACTEAKNLFLASYPFESAYVIFDEPYFKLKVGNFRTRMQAQYFLNLIKTTYPQAYIAKDILDVAAFLDLAPASDLTPASEEEELIAPENESEF